VNVGRPAIGEVAAPGHEVARHETPDAADRRELVLSSGESTRWRTRFAGLFLFLPLLARLGFSKIVDRAGYPGTKRVPADAALLSLLTLKLLDKERHSHIDDFNFEDALGLFAGLNVLPKKSFASDYSYRTQRIHQQRLLAGWVKRLSPVLLPEARSFSLDFHPIPHRGDDAILENHYIPCRGQAAPSVQTFFAQEHEKQFFVLRQRQSDARRASRRSAGVRRLLEGFDRARSRVAVL
jgi:hypothetical protein